MMRSLAIWSAWGVLTLTSLYFAALTTPYLFAAAADLRLEPNPSSEEFALRLHAGGGLASLVLGPWQFLPVLRQRLPLLHRAIGYGYLASVGAGVAGALVLAQTPMGAGANAFAFNTLAILWTISAVMALKCARAREWRDHQRWMIRSFALTFAAVTLRAGMPTLGLIGFAWSDIYSIVAWASWTINVVVVEWLLLPLLMDDRTARATV
jgi:hypothetical protein